MQNIRIFQTINYFLTLQYLKCHNPHFECHKTNSDIAIYLFSYRIESSVVGNM
jgi:hypothetical protein